MSRRMAAALLMVFCLGTARAQLGSIASRVRGEINSVSCGIAGVHCTPSPPTVGSTPVTGGPVPPTSVPVMASSGPPAGTTPPSPTPPAPPANAGDNLTLVQTQVIGTFQSSHQAPPLAIFELLNSAPYQANFVAQDENIPVRYSFTHQTITQQLEAGIRGFEFDTLADPNGGAYAHSAGLKLAGSEDTLIDPSMLQPGIKSISLPDWDFASSCYLFSACLAEIAAWSAANPTHFPIVVFVHHGGTTPPQSYLGSEYAAAAALLAENPAVQPTTFAQGVNAAIPDIIAEIQAAFPNPASYFTPDDLRAYNGANSTVGLRDVVLAGNPLGGSWPTIGYLRGKVLFFADPDYSAELESVHPGAVNSTLFPADDNGDLDPNVVVLDGMVDVDFGNYSTVPYSFDTNANVQVAAASWGIQAMVLQGFFIRAGVDSTAVEAQFNYTTRVDKFQSTGGGHFLSTFFDVLPPAGLLPSTYEVNPKTQFGGAVAVCNPVTTGDQITMGSVAFPFDGAIDQLGATTIIQQPLPTCPFPGGFPDV